MGLNADSNEEGHEGDCGAERGGAMYDEWWDLADDRAYWRRRFFILFGGVAALAVCAWMLPGPHQPSKREAAAAAASMDALARRQALPSAASGPAWPGPSSVPAVYPTASASLVNTAKQPTKKAQPKEKAIAGHHPMPTASPSPAKATACAPADIVLSLSTSQPSYAKGAHPTFSVYAVSTVAAPCTLTYGAGAVQVVVTGHGHVMWDSATCKPTPAEPVRFTRGVPQVLTVAWNLKVTHPAGCGGSLPRHTDETLDAVAMSHGQSSPVRTFKLANLPLPTGGD